MYFDLHLDLCEEGVSVPIWSNATNEGGWGGGVSTYIWLNIHSSNL